MQVGAGILGALAVAASSAGWWLLAGLGLAAVLAFCAQWTVRDSDPDDLDDLDGIGMRWYRGLGSAARLARMVFFATVLAAYLVPERPGPAAAVFVAVVTAADAAGLRINAYWRRWITGLLIAAAVGFVAVSFAIAPLPRPGGAESPGPGTLLLAAALFLPLFAGLDRTRLAVGTAFAIAVAGAALYQLGPVRLGLAVTSLREVLAAADAQALEPVLAAVVALATVPAALLAFTAARELARPRMPFAGTLVGGLAAALLAVVLTPPTALLIAAAFALGEVLAGAVLARRRGFPAIVTVVLTACVLGGLVLGL
ncbi:hypothetical protein ABZ863_14895 [Saccharomonospora sp. NPDC046836]|uniref:hypothetical protein n=1 Tax=Saccharomonospora sp. NPDC046836 TaxID=3156921 RepID=UPI0033D6EC0E